MAIKVLFILKRKELYSDEPCYPPNGMTTGLLNSAKFVADMLRAKLGYEVKLVVVTDNNDIDREVHHYKPNVVIIEALWVVPEKFAILSRLHPHVHWIVRLHSTIPFVANEGIAMKWILEYVKFKKVSVSCNDTRMIRDLSDLYKVKHDFDRDKLRKKLLYQPNYYPPQFKTKHFCPDEHSINIGCFGAIRPLKNQLAQAVAAIRFAEIIEKKLFFYINADRVEMKGAPVLHNLIELFKHLSYKGYNLVLTDWTEHHQFLTIIGTMDINMQVSYSETFNIVAADSVSQGVPIVVSNEVRWSSSTFWADPNETASIIKQLLRTYEWPQVNVDLNQKNLENFDHESIKSWKRSIEDIL